MGDALYAPWRMDYIRSIDRPAVDGCFLCAAASAEDASAMRDTLVLWRSGHSVVLINRYPYTNGHLLICPRAHKSEFDELSDDELMDLQTQSRRALKVLKMAVSAQGFNLGMNLGRCAGAGVPGHVHQHVVPRWAGDTNFMGIVGEVRIVPQAISRLYDELRAAAETIGA